MQNNIDPQATKLSLPAAQNPTDETVNLWPAQIEQQKALGGVIVKIRESLNLETIFKTTAIEVRKLLKADRVGVFRFYPELDWEGEFVSEDVDPQWTSAIATKVYDYCFGEQFAAHYQQGKVQAVADIYNANLSACHAEILAKFQVRANLIVPLLRDKELWGLLCVHQCSNPREWSESEINFTKQIAEHLTVAIQQAEYLKQAQDRAEQQQALTAVIARIRESFELETIFQIAVSEVRKLLKTDRVAVFRFSSEENREGRFVCEDLDGGGISIIGDRACEGDFSENFSPLYLRDKVNAIADIYLENLDEKYLTILKKIQVRANIVAPLLKGNQLWGLLCIHQCSGPRRWEPYEIEFVSQIAEQLGVAIKQTEYLEQIQVQSAQLAKVTAQEEEAKRQKVLAITIDKIRQSLDIETIFNTASSEVRQLLQADRVAIYQFNPDWSGTFVAESIANGWTPLVDIQPVIADTHLQATQGGRYKDHQTFAVDDIYTIGHADCHIALLEQFEAKAYAIAPILQGDKLWGLLAAYQNSAPRFWQQYEIDLLAQISTQLGIGLQQAEYVKQQAEYVQKVQIQAAQLVKATERQRALATTVEKIRQSLDIDTIFQTTTQEVRQLLEVERVAIYRFYNDWSGEFVADSIVSGWTPIFTNQPAIANVLQSTQGGKYPRNETFVPILQGEKLWGLLVAYQNSQPRYWQNEEINLLAQVGVQLGVALQQAELLKQTRQQAEELSQTLEELKQSQARLIQGEKMAGLGQLVAGVAHEINNPVNFILGNLTHVNQYTQALLRLIHLYHKHYPDLVPEIKNEEDAIDLDFLNEDLPKTLASMNIGADRIRGIVSSLRTFSRIDEAQMKLVDIHEGIDSTLLILQHRFKEKSDRPSIEVIKQYSSLPLVECYPAQLNQVFMNVLTNGIDALQEMWELPNSTRQTPIIWIRTRTIADRVSVSIRDNGPGIPEDVRSRIFDPFFTTKAIGKGTGLGLSISYQIIVEKHKGQLQCISDRDRGTEFLIEIPIEQPNARI